MLISCGSSNNSLSQFSKRKYLKKFKPSKRIKEEPLNTYAFEQKEASEALFATKEVESEHFVLEEIEEIDSEILIPKAHHKIAQIKRELPKRGYQPIAKYATIDSLSDEDKPAKKAKRKLHPWSVATIVTFGLVLLLTGIYFVIEKFLLFFALIFLMLLVINWAIGTIALVKINKFPKKYKGRGWSFIAIVLGIISSLLLFVASMAMQNYGV